MFLVGRVLSDKPVNKEGFKRQMRYLWRPKANVVVTDLEDNRFAFGFKSLQERNTIVRGGPWLYNKQNLLVLGEVDNLAFPARVPLFFQEFWIQFKGIPLCYMTRPMGQFLGNLLGESVVTDQSRKEEQFGSILRVRVRLDVRKPLRRFLTVQLEGKLLNIDARYEKLPLTCFLCGMMDHVEDHCERFTGEQVDDQAKPYGRWFQNDVLEKDYIRPAGRRFGLDPQGGWVMSVSQEEEWDVPMDVGMVEGLARGERDSGGPLIPDLTVTHDDQDCVDNRALVPCILQDVRGPILEAVDCLISDMEIDTSTSSLLFDTATSQQVGIALSESSSFEDLAGGMELMLLDDGYRLKVRIDGSAGDGFLSPSMGSDSFIFAPFTLGMGGARGYFLRGRRVRRKRNRLLQRQVFALPKLGKRASRGLEKLG